MVSESINTAILIIAGIIVAAMVSAALITQVGVLDSAIRVSVRGAQSRIETSISIVHVALNTSSSGRYFVVYVKNVGGRAISVNDLEKSDVYLSDSVNSRMFVYGGGEGYWDYLQTLQDNIWSAGETIVLRVYNSTAFIPPTTVKFVLPNGISAEYTYIG